MRTYTSLAAILVVAVVVVGCSGIPTPHKWRDHEAGNSVSQVDHVLRSILKSKKYRLESLEESQDPRGITYRTSWNYGSSASALFSGTAIRRMVFVELTEILTEPEIQPLESDGVEGSSGEGARSKLEPRYTLVNGRPKQIKTFLSLAIVRQRNTSIKYPGADPENGSWSEAGSDEEEVEHIIFELRSRLEKLGGKSFDVSDRSLENYERNLRGQMPRRTTNSLPGNENSED